MTTPLFPEDPPPPEVPPPPGGLMVAQVFTRHDWGAAPPLRPPPQLTTPVTKVVTTWADVEPCSTPEECKARVRLVQKNHMERRKLDDIEPNFLIGGDGNIYEGRGWFNVGPVYPSNLAYANDLNGKSIEIAFIDKEAKKPNEIQARAVSDCVAYGLITRHLQEKVQFYWRTPDEISYVSSYQGSQGGSAQPGFGVSVHPELGPRTTGVAYGVEHPKD